MEDADKSCRREQMKILVGIFFAFLKVGAFTFGGGYAMIPLIEREVVSRNRWLDPKEFVDVITFAQSFPGAYAINAATFIGYRIARVLGASLAALGATIPSFVVILVIVSFFVRFQDHPLVRAAFKGIYPAIVVMIAMAVWKIGRAVVVDYKGVLLAVATFVSIVLLGVHPIISIVAGGILGWAFQFWVRIWGRIRDSREGGKFS
ncbi:MAG: chromate transporter [bacterium]